MKKKIKALNSYAGIGGNRLLWQDVDVVAVESDHATADVYQSYFPNDEVIVTDAHQFLLDHYKEFDFIWLSPPCPSHSDIRRCGVHKGQYNAIYPDMTLYQEILLLKHFAPKKTKWVVENVKPYYQPLIEPTKKLHRHVYWSNFKIGEFSVNSNRKHNDIVGSNDVYGFNVTNSNIKDKRKALRNMVDPELGAYILNCALENFEYTNSDQMNMFSLAS